MTASAFSARAQTHRDGCPLRTKPHLPIAFDFSDPSASFTIALKAYGEGEDEIIVELIGSTRFREHIARIRTSPRMEQEMCLWVNRGGHDSRDLDLSFKSADHAWVRRAYDRMRDAVERFLAETTAWA